MTICFSIVRTKALALILGPSGVGLIGLYSAIVDFSKNIAGMGINSSGVREIAKSLGSGDNIQIAKTVRSLRRIALILGAVGGLLVATFSRPISRLTFGTDSHAASVALLAIAVFLGAVSAGQIALIQGMRQIGNLARVNIFGAFFGTILGIPLIYILGERGIPLLLIIVAVSGAVASWWFARQVSLTKLTIGWIESLKEARELLKLGFAFMSSSFLALGTAYIVRVMVMRLLGVPAAGYYQSAWALAGLYVGFILQAMGADFFPRLTAEADNHKACNRLINEQAEVGMLIAIPGILGTLTFAPLVIYTFYSSGFTPAIEVLRWHCLGMLLRVLSWPLGYLMVAKAEKRLFIVTEVISNLAYIGLVWIGIRSFGVAGTGIAFLGLYLIYLTLVYFIASRLSEFRWSPSLMKLIFVFSPVILFVFVISYFLSPLWVFTIGTIATVASIYHSLKKLAVAIPTERVPGVFQKIFNRLRILPEKSNADAIV